MKVNFNIQVQGEHAGRATEKDVKEYILHKAVGGDISLYSPFTNPKLDCKLVCVDDSEKINEFYYCPVERNPDKMELGLLGKMCDELGLDLTVNIKPKPLEWKGESTEELVLAKDQIWVNETKGPFTIEG